MSALDGHDAGGAMATETVVFPLGSPERGAEASGRSAWLLAAASLLALGPLLAVVAVIRALHPGIFPWGAAQLDPRNAALSALALVGAGTMAAVAAAWAGLGWRRRASGLLATALLLGVAFLGLRYDESLGLLGRGLAWGDGFKPVVVTPVLERALPNPGMEASSSTAGVAVDPEATTVPPPAPAPRGLAGAPAGGASPGLVPVPAHGELFFGLFHLLNLAVSMVVLVALVGTVRGFSRVRRAAVDPPAGVALAGGTFPWQLAIVAWVFTVALLYVAR